MWFQQHTVPSGPPSSEQPRSPAISWPSRATVWTTTTIEDKGGYKEHEAQVWLYLLKDRREIQKLLRPFKEEDLKMWPWNRSIQPQIIQTQTTLSRVSSKCGAKSHSQLTSRSPERTRARFFWRLRYWCSSPTVNPSHSQTWQFRPHWAPFPSLSHHLERKAVPLCRWRCQDITCA